MPVDFDQIEVGQTIDQTGGGDFAKAPKVIFVDFANIAPDELFGAVRDAVEHLGRIVEVMNRAENEIEFVPIFIDPVSARGRSFGIVVEFDAGANLHIGIRGAELIDFIKIDAVMVTVVIGKGDVGQSPRACAVSPRLQQLLGIRLNAMSLRMAVVIGEELMADR